MLMRSITSTSTQPTPDRLGPVQDLAVQGLASGAGQHLAVAQALDPMPLRQHHRGRHHRSRQRPAPNLVDAGDALEAGQPQLALVAHVRVARLAVLAARRAPPNDRSRGRDRSLASAALAQRGGLADAAAEEVELGSTRDAVADHLDLLDARRVDHEGPLHADAAGDAAHGDLLVQATAAQAHDRPLEDLDALAVALDHLDRHANRVAGGDLRERRLRSCSRSSSLMASMMRRPHYRGL